MGFITLILKECGHYGLVSEHFKQDRICCTQCEVKNESNRDHFVRIVRKKIIPRDMLPRLGFEKMNSWIKKRIEDLETKKI